MKTRNEILKMLDDVPMKNGMYVISNDMDPDLKAACERTNKWKEERNKTLSERRKVKHSMGLL